MVAIAILLGSKIASYIQTYHLCNLILDGKTNEAIRQIEHINDVNAYSAPLFLHRGLNIVGISVRQPLVEACRAGNYDIVIALLNKGADPNKHLKGGWSPIEAALLRRNPNRLDIIKELILHGANVDFCGSGDTALFNELQTIMYTTPSSNDIEATRLILDLLLDNGASPTDDRGNSIVHYVSYVKDSTLLDYIIDKYGYSIDTKNNNGKTPLMWAINSKAVDNVEFLLAAGADPNAKDHSGKSILDYAIDSKDENIIALVRQAQGQGGNSLNY